MAETPRTPTGSRDEEVRLAAASYAQERVWLASQLSDVPTYHVADRFVVHAEVGEAQLRGAFEVLTARHAALRTAFRVVDGMLYQVVRPRVDLPLAVADLSGGPADKRRARLDQLAEDLMYEPFDLTAAPLWRAAPARLGDGGWTVLFVAHHTVCDPASLFNLHAELTELCVAMELGREPVLPHLELDYADYAERQREQLDGAGRNGSAAFWRERLAGLPETHSLPVDRPRPAKRGFRGAELRAALPPEVRAAVPRMARSHRATVFMVHLAAYAAVLHRRSGSDDIAIGVPVAGRGRVALLPMVGTFVNMVVLRVDTSGGPSFAQLVDRVRQTSLEAWRHQEMPFQRVVELAAIRRRAGVPPLYQLGFNLLGDRGFGAPSTTAEDDLLLEVAEGVARLEYSTALFDQGTAQSLLDDYLAVLAAGLADPATPISVPAGPSSAPAAEPAGCAAEPAGPVPAPRPLTATEQLVTRVWSEVLGVPAAVEADFFALGGHSLQALRVLARLARETGVSLSLQSFFTDTTAGGLAAELDRQRDGSTG